MYKIFNFIIFILFLSSCSIDNNSGFWQQKNIIDKNIELADNKIDKNSDYETFKKQIIKYGKESTFPKLDDKNE